MSPDRPATPKYDGPERRVHHRRAEDVRSYKYGWFSTWQWAVLGAYLVAVVLSVVVGLLADRAIDNTKRIDEALCHEIAYLDRQSRTVPTPRARKNLKAFANDLRPLSSHCPPPDPSLVP
jgi:uncharacterized membrane-anchored protein YhcB (DUF1043 family)